MNWNSPTAPAEEGIEVQRPGSSACWIDPRSTDGTLVAFDTALITEATCPLVNCVPQDVGAGPRRPGPPGPPGRTTRSRR